jgi:putative endonuclease
MVRFVSGKLPLSYPHSFVDNSAITSEPIFTVFTLLLYTAMIYIMVNHLETGSAGEQVACDYLSSLGYLLIERNFRVPFGEIDIIARDPNGTLAIVEVKTLLSHGSINPEDNLTKTKFLKLSRVASFYANANPFLVSSDIGFRLDLITIVLYPDINNPYIIKIGKNYFAVSHYKNISF